MKTATTQRHNANMDRLIAAGTMSRRTARRKGLRTCYYALELIREMKGDTGPFLASVKAARRTSLPFIR